MISANIDGWLLGHAAFVVPIAFALYRVGIDAPKLAADLTTMRLMVLATRQAFNALQAAGNAEIPKNLRILYRLPTVFVIGYWRRVLKSPRGELWFGRTQPSRARGDARASPRAARSATPQRASHAQPRSDYWLLHPEPLREPQAQLPPATAQVRLAPARRA